MADITYVPAERFRPDPSGGRTRRWVEADLTDLPAVAQRKALDERLLAGTCAITHQASASFTREDLGHLLLATAERFGGESALLRRQAVLALGEADSQEAVLRLSDLAVSPLEHDSVRVAALTALGRRRPADLLDELAHDPSVTVREVVRQLTGVAAEVRPAAPAPVAHDPESGLGDSHGGGGCPCCRC
jgi:HEAT repeat protein